MNLKIFFLSAFVCGIILTMPAEAWAQRKERLVKPIILVYGSDVEAFAAALQSAKSNVPTLWVLDKEQFVPSLTNKDISFSGNVHLDGGLWREFLINVAQDTAGDEASIIRAKSNISAGVAMDALRTMLSKQQNLTVLENVDVKRLVQTKRGWNLVLSDRSRYELRTLVDASSNLGLVGLLGMDQTSFMPNTIVRTRELSKELSRTVVTIGVWNDDIYGFKLQDLYKDEKDHVFALQSLRQFGTDTESIPLRMNYAQAVGASAAYTAFFRKPLVDLKPRTVQKELLGNDVRISPYVDVPMTHPHFHAIQRIYLCGIFDNVDNHFQGQDSVRFDEVSAVLNRLYSRSQLWFHEHKGDYFRLKDAISLVKFLGMRGDDIDIQIQNDWATKLKFQNEFDLDRLVTREEFVVLLDLFSGPFDVRVNQNGVIQR